MASLVIVAAGEFPRKAYPRYLVSGAGHLVCCDGAFDLLSRRGFTPDAVVGDFDSVRQAALGRFGGEVVHVPDQETNDLTKAWRFALDRWDDISEIHIIGATGRREDHSVANMSLLMEYRRDLEARGLDIPLDMVSDHSTIIPVGGSCSLHVGQGRAVSLFTQDPALRVRSQGLVWPTDEVVFDAWWKASLNRAAEDVVTLTFSHKAEMIVVLD